MGTYIPYMNKNSVPSSQSQLVNPRMGTIAVKYNLNVHIFIKKVFYRTNVIWLIMLLLFLRKLLIERGLLVMVSYCFLLAR